MAQPVRRCVACRRTVPKATLLRLVVADGVVTADPPATRPGRGAYLCGRDDCTRAALRRGGALLRRALRTGEVQVTVDDQQIAAASAQHRPAGEQEDGKPPRQAGTGGRGKHIEPAIVEHTQGTGGPTAHRGKDQGGPVAHSQQERGVARMTAPRE